jgi:hypothetical protein
VSPAPLLVALLGLGPAAGRVHPMHTAVAEVTQADPRAPATIRIRVFADDLERTVRLPADPVEADSAMSRYVRGTFALADRAGRPLRLTWGGAERSGDVILLRLTAPAPGGLAGARVASLLLCERFADQVNIVRAVYGGRTTTLLFLRGETAKTLP